MVECVHLLIVNPVVFTMHMQNHCLMFQIRLSVVTNDIEVLYTVFNSEGRDRMNWFRPENIISSSFSDIDGEVSYGYFTLEG